MGELIWRCDAILSSGKWHDAGHYDDRRSRSHLVDHELADMKRLTVIAILPVCPRPFLRQRSSESSKAKYAGSHFAFERLSGRLMQRNPKQRPRAFGARPRR